MDVEVEDVAYTKMNVGDDGVAASDVEEDDLAQQSFPVKSVTQSDYDRWSVVDDDHCSIYVQAGTPLMNM